MVFYLTYEIFIAVLAKFCHQAVIVHYYFSTYVKFDIIRRILSEFFDINVVLVMGLTDIDDKIIKRANESGQSWQSITERYEKEFISDMDSLNVLKPIATCKVTNYIPQIVEFVEKIVNKNGAYVGKDGDFSVNLENEKIANIITFL